MKRWTEYTQSTDQSKRILRFGEAAAAEAAQGQRNPAPGGQALPESGTSEVADSTVLSDPLKTWKEHPIGNPLYFSVVTFTSLGYGDIQPKGWFKFFAASEALTSV